MTAARAILTIMTTPLKNLAPTGAKRRPLCNCTLKELGF